MLTTRWTRGLAAVALVCAGLPAVAQTAPLSQELLPYVHFSPEGLEMPREGVAAQHDVHIPGASWLRLRFGEVRLPEGARLRLTSLRDGARQHLDAGALAQWRHTSAYFNGDTLRVELLAAGPGLAGHFSIVQVVAGRTPPRSESLCGPDDDRVPSGDRDRARLLEVGCTASLTVDGCLFTSGHCMRDAGLVQVVEFNVPASLPDGTVVHPAPSDQYVPTSRREFSAARVGDDWGVFTVFPNSETGLMPLQAQGTGVRFARFRPVGTDQVRIAGYGADDGSANQTLQAAEGPVDSVWGFRNVLNYRVDTMPGTSGAAVQVDGRVVAIHTHGGCYNGGGVNRGTLIANRMNFLTAYSEVCGVVP